MRLLALVLGSPKLRKPLHSISVSVTSREPLKRFRRLRLSPQVSPCSRTFTGDAAEVHTLVVLERLPEGHEVWSQIQLQWERTIIV